MSFPLSDGDSEYSKWKVADLKKELKNRGLSIEGKKNDLILRLQLAMGDSALLDDTPNDHDDLLEDDVLSDEEALDDSDLTKADESDKKSDTTKPESALKRKSIDSDPKQPKKIVLNRNAALTQEVPPKVEGKENDEKTESASAPKVKVTVDDLNPQERLEKRAAKFGVAMSNEAKKEARAARFGLPTASSKLSGLVNTNIEVLKKRAEKFGSTAPGGILEKIQLEARMKKREERFGKVEKVTSTQFTSRKSYEAASLQEKKRARAVRFKMNS